MLDLESNGFYPSRVKHQVLRVLVLLYRFNCIACGYWVDMLIWNAGHGLCVSIDVDEIVQVT